MILLLKPRAQFPVPHHHSFIALLKQYPVMSQILRLRIPFSQDCRDLIRPWCKLAWEFSTFCALWEDPGFVVHCKDHKPNTKSYCVTYVCLNISKAWRLFCPPFCPKTTKATFNVENVKLLFRVGRLSCRHLLFGGILCMKTSYFSADWSATERFNSVAWIVQRGNLVCGCERIYGVIVWITVFKLQIKC